MPSCEVIPWLNDVSYLLASCRVVKIHNTNYHGADFAPLRAKDSLSAPLLRVPMRACSTFHLLIKSSCSRGSWGIWP